MRKSVLFIPKQPLCMQKFPDAYLETKRTSDLQLNRIIYKNTFLLKTKVLANR